MPRKKLLLLYALVFLLFFIVGSNVCYADLVPCGKSGGSPCTICHLIRGVQNLVNYGKNIVVTVAIVGIVIAGLIYMMSSGSESMITLAKSCFRASLMGFAITIAAWLVINITLTLIAAKTNLGVGVSGWFYFTCDTSSSATTSSSSSVGTGSTASTSSTGDATKLAECNKWCNDNKADSSTAEGEQYNADCQNGCSNQFGVGASNTTTGEKLSQSAAKGQLDKCGVGYANTNTLIGVQDTAVSEMCSFKSASGCDTNITSGTSGSHATGSSCTHEAGCKFDFTPTSCNDAYIKNNYTNTGTRSDGATCYSAPDGACYAREGNHWDMSTTRSCKEQGC